MYLKCSYTLALTLVGLAKSHSHSRHLEEIEGCGAPQLSEEEKADIEAQLATRVSQQFRNDSSYAMMELSTPVTIPVYFHVIQQDATVGALDDATVQDIVSFLQQEFDESSGPFKFELKSTTRTINPSWYNCRTDGSGGNEAEFKTQLREGGDDALNLYSCATTTGTSGLYGWAYFPSTVQSSKPYLDGVVFLHPSVVSLLQTKVTLVHETGHWCGLYHTFEGYSDATKTGGCNLENDQVSDTPAHQTPTRELSTGSDTCWLVDPPLDTCTGDGFAGVDPVTNYMNYLPSDCREKYGTFTPGQVARMVMMFETYRLGDNGPTTPSTPAPVAPSVPTTATRAPTRTPTRIPTKAPAAPVTPSVPTTTTKAPTRVPTKAPATSPSNTAPVNSTPTAGVSNPTNPGSSPTSLGTDISAFRCFNTYVRSRCSCALFTRGSACPLNTIAIYCRSGQLYEQRVLRMYRRFCQTR